MKANGKVIVSFLVSVGVFSAVQAAKYVGTLSTKEKKSMISVSKMPTNNITVCEGNGITLVSDKKGKTA